MKWKEYRRTTEATSDDGEIEYVISKKRTGKYYINASLPGGREHRLPFQNFGTVREAKNWVEQYEAKRARRARAASREKPIRF